MTDGIALALAPYDPQHNPLSSRVLAKLNSLLRKHFYIADPAVLVRAGSSAVLAYVNDGGRLVMAGFIAYSTHSDHAYIDWLLTLPAYRRQGIASHLLQHVARGASLRGESGSLGAARLVLHADANDAGLAALYERMGFRPTGANTKDVPREDGTSVRFIEMLLPAAAP